MDVNTIRVLEIDGGGARGYLALKFLISFVQIWGIDSREIWKYFDCICGTSVGGMIALGLAIGKTPEELLTFLEEKAPYIFSTNGTASKKATTADKLISITISGVPFYATNPETVYGSALLVSELQSMFGNRTMQNVLTNVVIPTYKVNIRNGEAKNIDDGVYTLCSNLDDINFVAQNELISNVALCTSAAPFYLPSILLENTSQYVLNGRYIDGGIYQNNPSSFGRNIAQIVKPTANRCCILSIGTGLGEMGFDDESPPEAPTAASDPIIGLSNLFALFSVASTGGQESVNKSLEIASQYSLNQLYTYRFQPDLDINQDTELDSTSSDVFAYYNDVNATWVNENRDNISTFIGHLIA